MIFVAEIQHSPPATIAPSALENCLRPRRSSMHRRMPPPLLLLLLYDVIVDVNVNSRFIQRA